MHISPVQALSADLGPQYLIACLKLNVPHVDFQSTAIRGARAIASARSGEGVEQRAGRRGLAGIGAEKIHGIEERDETRGEQQRLRAAAVEGQTGPVVCAGSAEAAGKYVIERRPQRSRGPALQAPHPLRK